MQTGRPFVSSSKRSLMQPSQWWRPGICWRLNGDSAHCWGSSRNLVECALRMLSLIHISEPTRLDVI
eukprot:7616067-Prorocentrum_lima.AAC.1